MGVITAVHARNDMRHLNASGRLIIHIYFSYPANCISLILPTVFCIICQIYFFFFISSTVVYILASSYHHRCSQVGILAWDDTGLLIWTVFLLFYQMHFLKSVKCIPLVLLIVFLCQHHPQCNQAGMLAWNDRRHLNAV